MKPAEVACPFCGGTKFQQNTKAKGYFIKKQAARTGKDTSNHLIRCTKCGAKGPLKHSEAEALAAWNARHRTTNHQALVDALAKGGFMMTEMHNVGSHKGRKLVIGFQNPDDADDAMAAISAAIKEVRSAS